MITSSSGKQLRYAAAAILVFLSIGVLTVGRVSGTGLLRNDGSDLVGNWIGESICTGSFPACHDEKVIYRIPKAPDESGKVTITADKIIDGKPVPMGDLDFKYDSEKGTLVCDFRRGSTHGLWEFTVKGNAMEGTLVVLPEKTLARRVKLRKDVSPPPSSAGER